MSGTVHVGRNPQNVSCDIHASHVVLSQEPNVARVVSAISSHLVPCGPASAVATSRLDALYYPISLLTCIQSRCINITNFFTTNLLRVRVSSSPSKMLSFDLPLRACPRLSDAWQFKSITISKSCPPCQHPFEIQVRPPYTTLSGFGFCSPFGPLCDEASQSPRTRCDTKESTRTEPSSRSRMALQRI